MVELKPCPFCGGAVRFIEGDVFIDYAITTVECATCEMTFSQKQFFTYSNTARVALNESFYEVWNRRVDGTDG